MGVGTRYISAKLRLRQPAKPLRQPAQMRLLRANALEAVYASKIDAKNQHRCVSDAKGHVSYGSKHMSRL